MPMKTEWRPPLRVPLSTIKSSESPSKWQMQTRGCSDEESLDAILCIDSMNRFPSRLDVFKEWLRVLRPGRRAVFTDPVVISGTVTNDELALRSSIGLFLFVPPGVNEHLIEAAGFLLIKQEDVTENAALVSRRRLQ